MRLARAALLTFVVGIALPVQAQAAAFDLSGFWESLAIGVFRAPASVPITNQFNARLDLRWYPTRELRGYAAGRVLTTYGGIVESVPGYGSLATRDPGWLDLTYELSSAADHVAYLNFDRFSIQHTSGSLEIQAGRQRVNWGVNQVWNPNDIFNASSFFDITYVEKPGSDAMRVRYYTGPVSSAEAAVKVDFDDRVTAAGLFRTNIGGYDVQLLAGSVQGALGAGFGWSGQLGTAGFNGEVTYFGAGGAGAVTDEQLMVSAGANYTFPSSLMLSTEFIYNSLGATEPPGSTFVLDAIFVDARTLSRARWNVMAAAQYQLSPLSRLGLASVFSPDDRSVYVSPQIDHSLSNNITLSVVGQLLLGDAETQFSSDNGSSVFAWLKGSF